MALFPLQQPLEGSHLIRMACHLYKISLVPLLPLNLLIIFIYHLIRVGDHYLPHSYWGIYKQISLYAGILLIPLFGAVFSKLDKISKDQAFNLKELSMLTAQRFISLTGCLISILLLPAIIIGLGIFVNLVLGKYQATVPIFLAWNSFLGMLIFAVLVPKIFAPILVVTQNQDANNAIEKSGLLIKNFYFRTFWFSLYAILLLIFLSLIPKLLAYFPSTSLSFYLREGIGDGLLLLIGPWSFALLFTQMYDLICRKKAMTTF